MGCTKNHLKSQKFPSNHIISHREISSCENFEFFFGAGANFWRGVDTKKKESATCSDLQS